MLAGCAGRNQTPVPVAPGAADPQPAGEGEPAAKVQVVTSFYPLYFFASSVGGERVQVVSLVPGGAEPHDWEPKASDIKRLNSAQVFIYNGAGFEPWVDRVLQSLDNRSLVVVDSSEGLVLLRAGKHAHADEHEDEHTDEHEDEHQHEGDEHDHGPWDPHIWLDPVLAQHQVQQIAAALSRVDPPGTATYEENARALIEELQALDTEYQVLSACPRQEIVISHAFFAYPAQRYGLEQEPIIASISPDAEPTPKQVAELVQFVREHGIRHIFFETLVSDRVARVIADETGARTMVLNPIEGLFPEEIAQGMDYLVLMRENLANLKVALECPR